MNGNFFLIFLTFTLTAVMIQGQLSHKGGNCPLRASITNCMPICRSDFECSFNRVCCPNKCGSSSCIQPSPVYTGNDSGYKGSGRDPGVYCGGVKCSPYEKCELDRSTKREKCVRT